MLIPPRARFLYARPAHGLCRTVNIACTVPSMAGALAALDEAVGNPENARDLSDETRAGLPPRREAGFAAFAPLSLPRRFVHYEIRRELAVGGMGTVYEAQDTRLGRAVALKMIRGAAFSTAAEKARFAAEAGTAASLDHPHIVPICEVGEAGGAAGEGLIETVRGGKSIPT